MKEGVRWAVCWLWGPAASNSRVLRYWGSCHHVNNSHCPWVPAYSQLCTMGQHFLNPGPPRFCLSQAHLNLSSMWGLPTRATEVAGGCMRCSPVHSRATLMATLVTTCTVTCSSTVFPQHWSGAQIPTSNPQCPCALPLRAASSSSGGELGCCRRVSAAAAACLHGPSTVQSTGLGDKQRESISRGIALPLPVLPEEGRSRGGAGRIMTLPSLLTFMSPCNVLGCLTLFCH